MIKAAPMHDLGKIAVDDAILRKPGRFTPEEFEKMKAHAAEGARIVHEILKGTDDEDFQRIAENVAHYHHERWDGSGYPDGLKGEEIPLEARIMAIADVYDALVSKRVYKESMSFEKADAIIMEGMGTQFDKASNDGELVPTDAIDGRVHEHRADELGKAHQAHVAAIVAIGVVDTFEAIHVHDGKTKLNGSRDQLSPIWRISWSKAERSLLRTPVSASLCAKTVIRGHFLCRVSFRALPGCSLEIVDVTVDVVLHLDHRFRAGPDLVVCSRCPILTKVERSLSSGVAVRLAASDNLFSGGVTKRFMSEADQRADRAVMTPRA